MNYVYDVFGNEIEKGLDGDGNGTFESVTKYAYDQNQNGFLDLDSSGSLTTRRIYGNATDALFARIGASLSEDWYLTDSLGSVRDLVNSSGTLIDHIDYGSFGDVTNETSPSNSDAFRFTARPVDATTGLQNNRARWYNFTIGWIGEDPAQADINTYRYAGNNPANATDPSGLDPIPERQMQLDGRTVTVRGPFPSSPLTRTNYPRIGEQTVYNETALSEKTYVTQSHKRRNFGARLAVAESGSHNLETKGSPRWVVGRPHATWPLRWGCVAIFGADWLGRVSHGNSSLPVFHREFSRR